MTNIITSASIMCMDLLNLGDELRILDPLVDEFHADIMDGHYVPNLSMSLDLVAACQSAISKPLDAHLMVTDPQQWIEPLLEMKVDRISLHADIIGPYAFRVIRQIKDAGCEVGIVLNPSSPLSICEAYLGLIDQLTIMTVDAGYAGQKFIPEALTKLARARVLRDSYRYKFILQVDGSCNATTYSQTMPLGATSFVMGSSGLFGQAETLEESAIKMHRELYEAAAALNFIVEPSLAAPAHVTAMKDMG